MKRISGSGRLAFAALALGLLGAAPARALDDGQESIFDTIIGLAGVSIDSKPPPDIDYRERAPLVLPGKYQLRPPREKAAHEANWPNDPDVIKRREAAAKARMPIPFLNDKDGARASTKRELMAGRGVRGADAPPNMRDVDCTGDRPPRECYWVRPDILRSQGVKAETPEVAVGAEPTREYLTQPPPGYRKATVNAGKGPQAAPDPDADSPNQWSFLTNPFRKKTDDE